MILINNNIGITVQFCCGDFHVKAKIKADEQFRLIQMCNSLE